MWNNSRQLVWGRCVDTPLVYVSFPKMSVSWLVSIFSLCSRREHFSLVDLNNVLIFNADDKVNRVGECFREMKLQAQVSLFHKLKMISRAVIWGQIKCQYGVTRVIITSIYLTARILVKLSNTREKDLDSWLSHFDHQQRQNSETKVFREFVLRPHRHPLQLNCGVWSWRGWYGNSHYKHLSTNPNSMHVGMWPRKMLWGLKPAKSSWNKEHPSCSPFCGWGIWCWSVLAQLHDLEW